jgi:tetratricopeptide (TPR) repeat protein
VAAAAIVCVLTLSVVALFGGAVGAEEVSPSPEVATLERELALRPDDAQLRSKLGDTLFREGDALASMVAQNPERTPDATWVPELRKAADVYVEVGELAAARKALKDAIELAPGEAALYEELAELYQDERREKPSAAPKPKRQIATTPQAEERAEAEPPAPTRRIAPTRSVSKPRDFATEGLIAIALLMMLGILSATSRAVKGKGDLAVSIEAPSDTRGTFSVVLSRKRARNRPAQHTGDPEARASSQFEHHLIASETHFRGIPARTYWVTIEGVVENADGERRPERRDREVAVEKGRTVRVSFDLRPEGCEVEVKIQAGGEPVGDARLALGGDPTSMRLAKNGVVRLLLPIGQHTLLIGSVDRAAEHRFEVTSFEAQTLEIDLDQNMALVFESCEAAVEPFLRGDLSVAASALERGGQKERADLLSARFHQSHGTAETAAARFEAAGRFLEAAELWAEQGEFDRAAELFEKGNDPARAGEMYNAAGDLLRAGRSYEDAGDYEAAIICYRESDAPRLLDALEKKGEAFEAGQLALDRGETSRAIRNFQHVGARDADYFAACRILATTFTEQGKLELAVQKADEAITFSRPGEASPDTFVWYADLLESAGRPDRALKVFEELAEREPEQEGLISRIEELRKSISRQKQDSAATEAIPRAFDDSSRYDIVSEVGSGGMGIVYHARDRRLGRDVALKRLPDNLKDHPRAVDLFLREARASASLNHPNIVTVHDVDQEGGLFFITMELLTGQTLWELVRQHNGLQALDVVRIGHQVATGLAFAHSQGIIHRDIKSANLFLTEDRVVKVMDFGLAKMTEEVRRATTVIGGTPYYMAPEQATGENVDQRADIYAFGVTLFELTSGRRPFEEGDVTWHHHHTPAPDPRSMGADIPEALAQLILQMMSKSPDDRPANADIVGRRLLQIGQSLRG